MQKSTLTENEKWRKLNDFRLGLNLCIDIFISPSGSAVEKEWN